MSDDDLSRKLSERMSRRSKKPSPAKPTSGKSPQAQLGASGSRPGGQSARSKPPGSVPEIKAPQSAGPLARHTVVAGDNLSAIAHHYYGSSRREHWMAIYEANKSVIGDNPSLIRPGQVLVIPRLKA